MPESFIVARYVVRADHVEEVGDRTALPHRVLMLDEHGDVVILRPTSGGSVAISRDELRFITRKIRRVRWRRFWRTVVGR